MGARTPPIFRPHIPSPPSPTGGSEPQNTTPPASGLMQEAALGGEGMGSKPTRLLYRVGLHPEGPGEEARPLLWEGVRQVGDAALYPGTCVNLPHLLSTEDCLGRSDSGSARVSLSQGTAPAWSLPSHPQAERLSPGETAPSAGCPSCDRLCDPPKTERHVRTLHFTLRS